MITSGYKNLMKQVLTSGGTSQGLLPIKDVGGTTRYLADYTAYPYTVSTTFTTTAANAGISVGTGAAESSENDYQLGSTITSDLTGSVSVSKNVDANGNSYIVFDVTLTNSGSSSVTISEIGYKQEFSASDTQSGTTTDDYVFLIDRTLLSSPITIAAGSQGVIRYTLLTRLGSSGVEDVKVDGVSVVDANNVAQLDSSAFGTTVVANPSATATDTLTKVQIGSTVYGIQGGGGSSTAYSTSEVKIGTWIDGSDLFQKTLYFVEASETSQKTYDIGSLNIDFGFIVSKAMKLGIAANNSWYSGDQYDSASYNRSLALDSTGKNIIAISNGWNFTEVVVTIQYTKSPYVRATPNMTSATTPSGSVTRSSAYDTDHEAWYAFCGTYGNDQYTWASSIGDVIGAWIQYEFDTAKKIERVITVNRNEGSPRVVKQFKLQASNDGTTYVDLDTCNIVNTNVHGKSTFDITNNNSYKYYKLLVTDSYDPNLVGFAAVELYEAI